MTHEAETVDRIVALFDTLPRAEREAVAENLRARARDTSLLDRLTLDQRAALAEGIAEADRGDVVDADAAFSRLAMRFGFARG